MIKNIFGRTATVFMLVFTLATVVMSTSCIQSVTKVTSTSAEVTTTSTQGEGFAIYLTKDILPLGTAIPLNQLSLQSQPLISTDDIVSYSTITHQLTLTESCYDQLQSSIPQTMYPTFVVCVDNVPIYSGTFWPEYSSAIASGVVIDYPLRFSERHLNTITISYASPQPPRPTINDLRNDHKIIDALQKAGKISGEGFAVYLAKDNLLPEQMPPLDQIVLAEQPIINLNDIVQYDEINQTMDLTISAYQRLTSLHPSVYGQPFVVCVDKKPIYWGAFMSLISSVTFNGVTIILPLPSKDPYAWPPVNISLGYPDNKFFKGPDPRADNAIILSLRHAGILIESNTLPESPKGSELYSWEQDGKWHFTVITGTNRNKTAAEIVAGDNIITDDGWVNLSVIGADTLSAVLGRLPAHEDIFWSHGPVSAESAVNFDLPPDAILNEIKQRAGWQGINLTIAK
jgi:hypothetical protein